MKIGWLLVTIVLGAIAALSLLRVMERAIVGAMDGQALVQIGVAALFGWLAYQSLRRAKETGGKPSA
jgi:uncharacterized membrane protein